MGLQKMHFCKNNKPEKSLKEKQEGNSKAHYHQKKKRHGRGRGDTYIFLSFLTHLFPTTK